MKYKLGSLFDGSGGFPLAGSLCGIEPVWASEIEPYPIAVTNSRFPTMKHLGDISKINGAKVETVDIITFGSPCQDLSVAGKRAGLKHSDNGDDETTRSGLFMEAVRIIKEMREATNGVYPRFAIWENVPGAFSSNNGEDFRIVLEELIKVAEPYAVMPKVPAKGWAYADSYCGDGWSLAYRVLDAQYWGVPQRRRRIYLVADLRGGCAKEILFEREGLRGNFTQSRTQRKAATPDVERCLDADDREGAVCYGISSYTSNAMKSDNPHSGIYEADTSRTLDLNGGNPTCNQGGIAIVEPVPYTLKIRSGCEGGGKGALIQEDKSATLATNNDQYLFQPVADVNSAASDADHVPCTVYEWRSQDLRAKEINDGVAPTILAAMGMGGANMTTPMLIQQIYSVENHPADSRGTISEDDKVPKVVNLNKDDVQSKAILDPNGIAPPLYAGECRYGGGECYVMTTNDQSVICLQGNGIDRADTAGCNGKGWNDKACYTLNTIDRPAVVFGDKTNYIVRRLTPTECARLQGFPDAWGHIEPKTELTEDEYSFWLEVRKTHDAINGRTIKDYTEKQMLTYYNKLWTDSAEYKMWGNGIALPCALYVMQGISLVE